jgi:hypothetical protein
LRDQWVTLWHEDIYLHDPYYNRNNSKSRFLKILKFNTKVLNFQDFGILKNVAHTEGMCMMLSLGWDRVTSGSRYIFVIETHLLVQKKKELSPKGLAIEENRVYEIR